MIARRVLGAGALILATGGLVALAASQTGSTDDYDGHTTPHPPVAESAPETTPPPPETTETPPLPTETVIPDWHGMTLADAQWENPVRLQPWDVGSAVIAERAGQPAREILAPVADGWIIVAYCYSGQSVPENTVVPVGVVRYEDGYVSSPGEFDSLLDCPPI